MLFENPEDALAAVKGGVQIKEINLGSIAASEGKVVCTKAVAMDQNDVKALEELTKLGIKIKVQKVPGDPVEDFNAIMKKAKTELHMN